MLERLGEQVRRSLEQVNGVADLQVEVLSGAAQVEIVIDRDAIARYGINVTDVQEMVEAAVGGIKATELLDGAKRFPVMLWLRRRPAARRRGAGGADHGGARR